MTVRLTDSQARDLRAALADPAAGEPLGLPGDGHTSLCRVRVGDVDVIIKRHLDPARHRQELRAYREWVPALGRHTPALLAAHDAPPALAMTAVRGHALSEATLTTAQRADAHHQAGTLIRALHEATPARTDLDLPARLAERGQRWLSLAGGILDTTAQQRIRHHLRELADLGPLAAVPCHLDLTPRNLLRADDGTVHLLDYEHARYDLAARDLVRLATRTWPAHPDLRDAFLDSHGPLTELDHRVIEHCSHLDTLTRSARAAGLSPPTDTTETATSDVPDHIDGSAPRNPQEDADPT